MPLCIFKKLGIGATRQSIYPQGKIDDVLVEVDKFSFTDDFIIVDFNDDEETPILLERPFVSTGRTLINVGSKWLLMFLMHQITLKKLWLIAY